MPRARPAGPRQRPVSLPLPHPTPPAPAVVTIVENRLTGAAPAPEALKAAVRRVLSSAGCAASAPHSVRLRITFNDKGAVAGVDMVRGQANAAALLECLRAALLSMRLEGTTGGHVVAEVRWR